MKRAVAYLILAGFLLSSTPARELLKAKAVIAHLKEHRQNDPSLDFIRFIAMHYITDDGNAADNEKESELPFKSSCPSTYTFLAVQAAGISFERAEHNSLLFNSCDEFTSCTDFYCMVWHPPQIG